MQLQISMIKSMKRSEVKQLLTGGKIGSEVLLKAWVRTKRGSKNVAFVALNDGSTINNIQVVVDVATTDEAILDQITTGACIAVTGILVESKGSGQQVEIEAKNIDILGTAHPDEFPLQPKKHSLEFLREIAHLRFRTNTFGAVNRIRHSLIFAIHDFFNARGFYNIHTPIITASDAEGAGETFKVSNFDFNNIPKTEEGEIDYKKDFFGKETNLTVSGQLEGELAAMALGKIYTFGPTFRAENSNTTRHLAEFWMIEPEVAFADLDENMDLGEELLKSLITYALTNCADDLAFLNKRLEDEEKLKKADERSPMGLVEKHFKKPVILYNYPKEIKAFYMKQNEDDKTVGAMDILFPGIGEMVGGSQREERLDKLKERMQEMNIPEREMWWYLESRKFGTAPHSGFGLGFERLVQFVTGMGNIRDVIPFPRTPKSAEF